MNIKKLLLIALFTFSIFFRFFGENFMVQAAGSQVYENVNPDNVTNYLFKRLKEKVITIVLTPFPAQKSDYYKELVKRRELELLYVANKKDLANIERTSQRYSSQVGIYVEYINNKGLTDKKKDAVSFLTNQEPQIKDIRERFSDQTSEWRFMVQDYDYLSSYINQLK